MPFLAPHRSPSNSVQCPHCGGQHVLSRCRKVGPNDLAQREISTIRTEEEENIEIRDQARNQQAKLLLGAGAVVAALGLGTYAMVSYSFGRGIVEDEKAMVSGAQLEAAEQERYDKAFAVAKQALGAADWRMMMPRVRSRERAQAQAEWLYQRKPYRPMRLTSYQFPQDMHVGEDAFVRLFVASEELETGFWIRLQYSGYDWLLDWEALGGYTREHWAAFLEDYVGDDELFRVHIQRSSMPDRHFFERGFTGDGDAFGVRIWALDREKHVHAIVDAESEIGEGLAQGVRWDLGEGYVVRLRWPDPVVNEAGYKFVEITEVLQSGWHISDRPKVVANSSK